MIQSGSTIPRTRSPFLYAALLLALPLVALPQLLKLSAGEATLHGHGYCYLWNPSLVTLHVSADALIALSYLAISLTLGILVYRMRVALPFHWMFLSFGTFILACGATHAVEIWTLWTPAFWFSANVKILTAIASVATAITLPALIPKVEATLNEARVSEDRRRQLDLAHAQLRDRQRTIEHFLHALPAAVLVINRDGSPYFANQLAQALLGTDVMRRSMSDITEDAFLASTDHRFPVERDPLHEALAGKATVVDDMEIRQGQRRLSLEVAAAPIVDDDAQVVQAVAVFQDITGRKTLEREFAQAQKMQAVGLLAGGIAHDFNNLLTAVFGYVDWLEEELPEGDALREPVEQIRKAAERAAGLTRHLLAFSRKQMLKVENLHLNQVVRDMEPMLRRLLPENIRIEWVCTATHDLVSADKSQIEQVVLNLVINARDAMPDGGRLVIEVDSTNLDAAYVHSHVGAKAGPHVMFAVTDTGSGMDAMTQARMFEPFFTTKGARGTGLGLSTVYGIVKQSGGNVWVYSELNRGTSIKVYLPAIAASAVAAASDPTPIVDGSEHILLVEDDDAIRRLCVQVLRRRGYNVSECENGERAIALARDASFSVDLLVTDVVLPGVNGRVVAETLRATHPALRVLYISGYTENAIVHTGVLDPNIAFLAKPFTPAILVERVRVVLDAERTD